MLFFWSLFDGGVGYITPLKIAQSGYSETFIGLIIGSSSVFGALFDFFLSKYVINTHFRRVFLAMLALCTLFPFFIEQGTLFFYIGAMAIWGFYYDLSNFGIFDYVGRKVAPPDHGSSFGIIDVFKSLGYILAPLIISLTIATSFSWQPFMALLIFLAFSICAFVVLFYLTQKEKQEYIHEKKHTSLSALKELHLWKSVGRLLLPVLGLTMLYNIFDGFFWTIGPILAETYQQIHPFNGLFLTLYALPPLFVGWLVGSITNKYGKKKTAFVSFGIGSLLLSFFALLHNPFVVLIAVFIIGCFTSVSLPAVDSAYADYISESSVVEKEIEALVDFFTNIGYIFGPILAGFIADTVGNAQAFSLLGIFSAVIIFVLFVITPKHITIPTQLKNL